MLPHSLSGGSYRDAWIAALIASIFEIVFLYIAITAMRLWQDKDIYAGLKNKVTPIGAKIVLGVLMLFFLLQSIITIKITNHLLTSTLYEDLGVHTFTIPLLLVGVFFCYSQTRAVFRSGEIFAFLVILALGLALLPSLGKSTPSEVLPMLDNGFRPLFGGIYKNLGFIESSMFLLMFSGSVKIERGFTRKFLISAGLGALVFVGFVFLFTTVFGPLAESKPLAIVNLTQVSSYISQNGRVEWIMVCVWLILLIMRFGVTFYCAFAAIRYVIGTRNCLDRWQPAAIAIPLAVVMYIIHAVLIVSLKDMEGLLNALSPVLLAFYIIIPAFFLILSLVKRRGKNV
jgi:spore germination protein KB